MYLTNWFIINILFPACTYQSDLLEGYLMTRRQMLKLYSFRLDVVIIVNASHKVCEKGHIPFQITTLVFTLRD